MKRKRDGGFRKSWIALWGQSVVEALRAGDRIPEEVYSRRCEGPSSARIDRISRTRTSVSGRREMLLDWYRW